MITNLGTTLHSEKATLEKLRTGMQTNYTEFQSFISSNIEKLQDNLAIEKKIMDELTVKTEKVKVMSVKLTHVNQQIKELKTEMTIIKSCVADINADLHSLIVTRDSLLTVSVYQHLAEKLKPIFSMMDRIVGVLEYSIPN